MKTETAVYDLEKNIVGYLLFSDRNNKERKLMFNGFRYTKEVGE